jgi:phasin
MKMATTKKQAEMFQFPAFDVNKMSETYRDYAEKAMAQSKENYAKMKDSAESATKTMETTLEKAQAGTVELSLKGIDAVRVSTDNSLSHLEALLGVKSMAEMIELQSTFFRKQADLMVDQTKAMQEAARKVAEDVSKPTKDATEKAIGEVEAKVKAA